MELQPTTRYPSVSRAFALGENGAVQINGLEVVDEQVVLLGPLPKRIRPRRRGRGR